MSGPLLGMSLGLLGCDSLVGSKRSWAYRVSGERRPTFYQGGANKTRKALLRWMVSLTSCVLANSLVGKQVK